MRYVDRMRMKIGFLGLGTMGEPVANNLRKAGHDLTVWNRTAAKAEHIVSKGGKLAKTPRECATGKNLVFTCLSDEKALDAVLEGADGILQGLAAGDVLVDLSTAGTRAARSMAERVGRRGAKFIACPVLGSKLAAQQAQIVLVVGGPAEARERARPALRAVSARLFEMDEPGHAALLKLCVNALGGAMIAGFAEALALGASGGLAVENVIEVIQASSFHSPLYLMKGEQIEKRDYAPRFALSLAEKDERLAQDAATAQGATMPVGETVRRIFGEAIRAGKAEQDVAVIAELLLKR